MLLAEIAGTQKKYDESETLIAKVLSHDPANPDALLLSARMRLANGENDKAVAELERIRGTYPKFALVYYQLGQAYLAVGDIAKAITSLNQAVKLAPNSADAILLLAETNIRTGAFKEASSSLQRLVEQRPDFVRARLLLADAYVGGGKYEEALDVYRQLEQSYPTDPEPLLLSGLALLREDRRDEARRSFDKALELAPAYLPALEQLINVDLIEKNYPAALQRANAGNRKEPKIGGRRDCFRPKSSSRRTTPAKRRPPCRKRSNCNPTRRPLISCWPGFMPPPTDSRKLWPSFRKLWPRTRRTCRP